MEALPLWTDDYNIRTKHCFAAHASQYQKNPVNQPYPQSYHLVGNANLSIDTLKKHQDPRPLQNRYASGINQLS